MVSINKFSNVPLYFQLKNLILEKIESGEFEPDSKILSEQDLCEKYDISRPTVRQAINDLTASGHLYKLKGKGTFVTRQKSAVRVKDYTGFTDSILDSVHNEGKEYISINVVNAEGNSALCEAFGLRSDTKAEFAEVIFISTLYQELLSFNTSYIPLALFPTVCEDLKSNKSTQDLLAGKYPLLPNHSKSVLDIVYTDHKDAVYLQVQMGQALIQIRNTLYSKSGQPVEFILTKYRADKTRLQFENHK